MLTNYTPMNFDESRPRPVMDSQPAMPWRILGGLTASITGPDVDARAVTTVDALDYVLTLDVPNQVSNIALRFETTADADAHTLILAVAAMPYMLAANGAQAAEYYGQGASLALVGGKQEGGNGFFVDTATVTDGLLDLTECDSAADRPAMVVGSLRGFKHLAFWATALESATTLTIEYKFY